MLPCVVSKEMNEVVAQVFGTHLAFVWRQRDDFMTGMFDGSRFMNGNVTCLHRDDGTETRQQTVYDGSIRLRSAYQEHHVRRRATGSPADLGNSRLREPVTSIAWFLLHVRFY